MVQANHKKSERLAADGPFKIGTIQNHNVQAFRFRMAFGSEQSDFEAWLYSVVENCDF